MRAFKFSIAFVLGTFCEEAAAIAKATSGSQAGSGAHRRLASNSDDSSRSGKAQGLDQAVRSKTKRQKTDVVTLDSELGTRRPRAPRSSVGDFGASEEDVKADHVEVRDSSKNNMSPIQYCNVDPGEPVQILLRVLKEKSEGI